jgi:hypothetical protein
MADLAACRAVIEKFKSEHPGIVQSISDLINLQESWPHLEAWKSYSVPGVYIMLNEYGSVIYVGESVDPAKRMGDHFRYDDRTQTLETKHSWRGEKPVSVLIVTVTDKRESLFLECYLIFKLAPPLNSAAR